MVTSLECMYVCTMYVGTWISKKYIGKVGGGGGGGRRVREGKRRERQREGGRERMRG